MSALFLSAESSREEEGADALATERVAAPRLAPVDEQTFPEFNSPGTPFQRLQRSMSLALARGGDVALDVHLRVGSCFCRLS